MHLVSDNPCVLAVDFKVAGVSTDFLLGEAMRVMKF